MVRDSNELTLAIDMFSDGAVNDQLDKIIKLHSHTREASRAEDTLCGTGCNS